MIEWVRRAYLKRAILIALVIMLALSLWKAVGMTDTARRAEQDADRVMETLGRLQRDPTDRAALAALAPALQATASSLDRLQEELRPFGPLFVAARLLPAGADWLADVPAVLSAVVPLAHMGAAVAPPFSEAAVAGGSEKGGLARYLAAANSVASSAPEIAARMKEAEVALGAVRGRPLGGKLRPLRQPLDRTAELLPGMRQGLELLKELGAALGMEGPRRYLLLGQNEREIRATGGFIGSAGAITMENGAVARLEYGSSYWADEGTRPPPPPSPLARYLGLGNWYLRDANWWPDFPATAAQVEQAWQRAGRGPVDGVIAFDQATVETLLRALGSIEVPGYGSISADNFDRMAAEQLYSQDVLATGTSFHGSRGLFLGAIGRSVVDRLLGASPAELLSLGKELPRLLAEKHIQLAFKDQRLIQVAHGNGWDGAIPSIAGDSLYVVDTTVSYGDTYPFVNSEVELQVQVADSGLLSHELVLSYRNDYPRGLPSWAPPYMVRGATFDPVLATLQEKPGFWGNWLRVYLPPDAFSISVDGLADPVPPTREFERTVVAGYLSLSPGENRVVRLRYASDAGDGAREDYRLFLQKQAGLKCRPISLEVTWSQGGSASYAGCPNSDEQINLNATR